MTMGFFDNFEKSVEGAVNSVFSKFASRDLKPVDFAVALRQESDEKAVAVGDGKKVTPNVYRIILSTPDFDKIESWGPSEFADELVATVTEHANSEGYSFIGNISVTFEEDTSSAAGEYNIISSATRTQEVDEPEAPAVFENASLSTTNPTIDVDGKRHTLTKPITVLGRSSSCDIVLDDSGVSRKHLELRVTKSGTIASDLGSTNGIFIEGNKTAAATLVDGNVITVGHTRITFWEPRLSTLSPAEETPPIFTPADAPPNIDLNIDPSSDSSFKMPSSETSAEKSLQSSSPADFNNAPAYTPANDYAQSNVLNHVEDFDAEAFLKAAPVPPAPNRPDPSSPVSSAPVSSTPAPAPKVFPPASVPDPFKELQLSEPITWGNGEKGGAGK